MNVNAYVVLLLQAILCRCQTYLHIRAFNPTTWDADFPFRRFETESTNEMDKNFTDIVTTPWRSCPLYTAKLSLCAYNGYINTQMLNDIGDGSWTQTNGGVTFSSLVSLWLDVEITHLANDSFAGLDKLEMLYIGSTSLTTVTSGFQQSLSALWWLCMEYCDLTTYQRNNVTDIQCGLTSAGLASTQQCTRNY
ncbi:hypothetical protein DPMN_064051 [Dreissena polymorpha]|uniref:Uncharacterized protein n=1 Tax=Dreissena polymorpha TaxID=45954 RepID=A0A9D4CC34_DREPO|nr:hypothetical protein DPMN_064051 [Dreissena polymorpha]